MSIVPQFAAAPPGYDPARGRFAPRPRKRARDAVNHPGKSRQDRMPVAARPRVEAAALRLAARKAAA